VKLKAASLFDKYNHMRLSGRQLFMDFCTGKSMRALTYDAIFKKIFSFEHHPKRLEHFLSALLEQDVTILKIMPVESERLLEHGSVMIMDVLVRLADNRIVDLEMQKIGYKFTGKRDSCYLSELVMRQYNQLRAQARDENKIFTYDTMQPVYTIIFLETSSPNIPNSSNAWEYDGSIRFTPPLDIEFLFHTKYIALDKFKKIPQNIDSSKKQWVSLLAANTPEEIRNVAAMSEEFFDIIVEISEFVQDVGKVMDMFSEALYMLDRNTEELMYHEAMQELNEARKKLEEKDRMVRDRDKLIRDKEQMVRDKEQVVEEQQKTIEDLKKQAEKEKIKLCIQMSPSKEDAFQNLYQRFQIGDEEAAKYITEFWEEN
jgi:hypothetical protein